MKITKIVQQKKNKRRFSIYVDGEYRMGISDEELIKHDLKVDDEISQELIDNILILEEKLNIRNRMLRLIRYRMRSSQELERRFIRNGYDQNLIVEVLEELRNEEILNDAAMIQAFINDNTNINPHGNRHIMSELRKKGIPEKMISERLSGRDEKEIALIYFDKKLSTLDLKDPKDRRKAVNRLLSRGFTLSVVYDTVNERTKGGYDQ